MLDRVTPRGQMRDELITITRMLLGLSPAVRGELPAPEADAAAEAGAAPDSAEPQAAEAQADKPNATE
jgi:acetyl-CoA carboxylase carboxyl transferase subunit beta